MTPERIAELREEIARNKATGYHDEGIGTFDSLTMEAALDALEEAQAELATAKDAYVELAAGIRITEAEGGPLEQANQEIDRLRAELTRLQSPAPVGGGVPELTEQEQYFEWGASPCASGMLPSDYFCHGLRRGYALASSRLPALKTGEVETLLRIESCVRSLRDCGPEYIGAEECRLLDRLDALRAQATTEGGKA